MESTEGINQKFPENRYKEATKKRAAVLHPIISGNSPTSNTDRWRSNPEHIVKAIISKDGSIHQLFASQYWSHH